MNVNDLVAINIYQFYHDLYQFNILIINSFTDIAITLQFGGHLGNMQIRHRKRHFSACQYWFLDSAYLSTPNRDIKPFSSQNACTFMKKRLFWIISRTTSFGNKITIYSTLAVLLMYFVCVWYCCYRFRHLGNKLNNDTFPWWKDANKDFMITFGFQHKILGQIIHGRKFSHCYFRPSVYAVC